MSEFSTVVSAYYGVFCLQHNGELVILIFWRFEGTSGCFYPEQGGRGFL